MKKNFLAGMTNAEFMRRHWQKKMLLVRSALPEYADAVSYEELRELAARDDVESRLVSRVSGRWRVEQGPFDRRTIARLPRTGWTLLVQGVDQVLPQAARLLSKFSFIPYARLDDVMVSYAAPGGGVGPHFDSYDVFLLQGRGRRRWRISRQRDLALVPEAPLRILRHFRSEHEWTLERGDLLYLPPRYAHDGVAVDQCVTYSIGFRAPTAQELGTRFLEFLQDRLALEGIYEDRNLEATGNPGRIPRDMVNSVALTLERIDWSREDVAEFLGRYLTEPKSHVVFTRPARRLNASTFTARARKIGVGLALASRMLVHRRHAFINGEAHTCSAPTAVLFARFADKRRLDRNESLTSEATDFLYEWYCAGYIHLESTVHS